MSPSPSLLSAIMRILLPAGALMLAAPSEGCTQATGAPRPTATDTGSLAGQHTPASSSVTTATRIRPGDMVELKIWREPTMSGRFLVDEDGEVVLPRLGRMVVTGMTDQALREDVSEHYRRYLRNPSIEVTVLRRITVNGAVTQPGLYPVDPTYTIADVLAEAGGVTSLGDRNDIRVLRPGEDLEISVNEGTLVGDTPIRSGDMIYVPERSWISRHTGIVATAVSGALSLIIAFAVN